MLVFAWYMFSGGMGLINTTNQCTSSITCSLSNQLTNGGSTLQNQMYQGYIQIGIGAVLGLVGLVLVGFGFTGGKKSVVYQQPQPSYQQTQSTMQQPTQSQDVQQKPPVHVLTDAEKKDLEEFRRNLTSPNTADSESKVQHNETRFCTSCGNAVQPAMKFCGNCGGKLQ